MKLEVRAEWRVADDAVEGGVQKYQYQSHYGKLHESFSNLKTESNRLLTMWMNGKKIAVEEIDVLEEKPPATDDEEEDEEAANKRQKT
ncbi:hypothetical protein HKI87_15g78830 [Chloropicon roscoffensis]|uniref:Uncharacterized protein n=1 Tax=Chloropicon roscoffensis TaxID=1461544 RepID=A0AAX4PJW4_9CHLO|mmetsp:Transcript_6331/g.19153  ORF Transcript_6331/g.19153 Transcript_6331/m.19153 type:complete len:88 (+) Transcript_6331:279-542(+)|eukprot:CAMPEP_0198468482 /NCGR_PEP_ID=MMETSP1456-20131121/7891_1 /TAXON_ID=1461544 ORGANISM="Unidentified sp., Strain RCC1871" /NCGR_SAMPLE_ID=MMETSP1456 /ASSEMBLY_ACC=CAM_ASM_001119 /LENGTH=87 /DNA_ID=CAMNT_0044194711 /DNA_START=255 /DNA_END=518 /DNA_ORIENTATION=+